MELDSVGRLLAPYLNVRTLTPLGGGLDNRTYEADGELVVRVAGKPEAELTRHEADVLQAVRAATDLAVPEPILVVPEAGLMVYPKLPGAPLAGLPQPRRVAKDGVATLDRFRRDIQRVRTSKVDVTPAPVWLAEARESYAVAGHVPAAYRRAIEAFLTEPGPPAGEPVFCRNDLGTEHILVDPETRTITGVIDWTDAAMADPAYDLGRLYRDLGPQVRPTAAAPVLRPVHRAGRSALRAGGGPRDVPEQRPRGPRLDLRRRQRLSRCQPCRPDSRVEAGHRADQQRRPYGAGNSGNAPAGYD
jgi:aminoglycoside phosphotransferase (APT) family kinase protein